MTSARNASQSPGDKNASVSVSRRQAIDEFHAPAALFAVDQHGDFRVGRGMVDWIVQDNVVRTEVADAQDVTVDRQMDLYIG